MKNHRTSMILLAATIIGLPAVALIAQTPAARKPSFDVISVKRNKDGGGPRRTGTQGNRFIAENVPLIVLIQLSYRGSTPAR